MTDRIRYAVVGLGYIAQSAVLPAFAHAKRNSVLAAGTEGHLTLDPGYEIRDELKQEVTRGKRPSHKTFPRRDQFAPELVYFSEWVQTDTDPEPDQARRRYRPARRPEPSKAKALAEHR
jgi:predicted dehydrogenase